MEDDERSYQDQDQIKSDDVSEEEARLDVELKVVRKMRLAFTATLKLLEAARDDLVEMGSRIDRLTTTSQKCRATLEEKNNAERDRKLAENRGTTITSTSNRIGSTTIH
jgi:D-alanyl-D-alanine dipeptidase